MRFSGTIQKATIPIFEHMRSFMSETFLKFDFGPGQFVFIAGLQKMPLKNRLFRVR